MVLIKLKYYIDIEYPIVSLDGRTPIWLIDIESIGLELDLITDIDSDDRGNYLLTTHYRIWDREPHLEELIDHQSLGYLVVPHRTSISLILDKKCLIEISS